jgi:hypothetical protein
MRRPRLVAVDVPVLDRLVEDRHQRVDQLLDRGGAQRADTAAAAVADHLAVGGQLAQVLRLAQPVGLKARHSSPSISSSRQGAKNPNRSRRRQR